MIIDLIDLERFCSAALRHAGVNEADAQVTAGALVLADAWGVFTHGSKNLRGYLRRVSGGGIRRDGRPRVVAEGPAWVKVDGDQALGMVSASFAMRAALVKAKDSGIGYAGLCNGCHWGAAGCYAVMAARESFLGFAMGNDTPTVTAPGARGAVMGSNPFSFAAPVAGEEPLLLDMATSTVAGGKVFRAAADGCAIPLGWVVDADGRPTTDPRLWPRAGALTPMAGHKGYGLALMIETLSAVVAGGPALARVLSWSFADPALATGHSAAFLAINVAAMPGGDEFPTRLAQVLHELRTAPRADGADRIFTPGEKEWEHRRRAIERGLELPDDVVSPLRVLAAESGLTSLLQQSVRIARES